MRITAHKALPALRENKEMTLNLQTQGKAGGKLMLLLWRQLRNWIFSRRSARCQWHFPMRLRTTQISGLPTHMRPGTMNYFLGKKYLGGVCKGLVVDEISLEGINKNWELILCESS